MMQLLLCLFYLSDLCSASAEHQNIELTATSDIKPNSDVELYIDDIINKFELAAVIAAKSKIENIVSRDEIEQNYQAMISALNSLLENLDSPIKVYAFIKNNGLERIVYPHLSDRHIKIKTQVLKLVKTLFNIAPTTLRATVSTKMVNQLLEIFENEENKFMKGTVLDVLAVWLPNNPTVQARLMKINGLEILYERIPNLDKSLVHSMIKLFTSIVKEHIQVRNSQKSEADKVKLGIYEKVGLLEKLSSSNVCKGLLDIFDNAFQSYEEDKDEMFTPILELVHSTEEFCFEHFKKQKKSLNIFENFLSFVKKLQNKKAEYVTNVDINEIKKVLTNYVDNLQFMKSVKEEF